MSMIPTNGTFVANMLYNFMKTANRKSWNKCMFIFQWTIDKYHPGMVWHKKQHTQNSVET